MLLEKTHAPAGSLDRLRGGQMFNISDCCEKEEADDESSRARRRRYSLSSHSTSIERVGNDFLKRAALMVCVRPTQTVRHMDLRVFTGLFFLP